MSDKGGAPARMRVVASGNRRGAAPAEPGAAAAVGAAEAGASAAAAAQPSLWLPAGLFILGSAAGSAGAAWLLL